MLVRVQVSVENAVADEPSTAFCGMPPSATDDCMGAFPAATLSTAGDKGKVSEWRLCSSLVMLCLVIGSN